MLYVECAQLGAHWAYPLPLLTPAIRFGEILKGRRILKVLMDDWLVDILHALGGGFQVC